MVKIIDFIKNNIHLLTKHHIKQFIDKYNIKCTEQEIQIIYDCIMNHYQDFLEGNNQSIKELKLHINPKLYQKMIQLYQEYENKYIKKAKKS